LPRRGSKLGVFNVDADVMIRKSVLRVSLGVRRTVFRAVVLKVGEGEALGHAADEALH
jgi:hypothetical protein